MTVRDRFYTINDPRICLMMAGFMICTTENWLRWQEQSTSSYPRNADHLPVDQLDWTKPVGRTNRRRRWHSRSERYNTRIPDVSYIAQLTLRRMSERNRMKNKELSEIYSDIQRGVKAKLGSG